VFFRILRDIKFYKKIVFFGACKGIIGKPVYSGTAKPL